MKEPMPCACGESTTKECEPDVGLCFLVTTFGRGLFQTLDTLDVQRDNLIRGYN